MQKAMPTKSRIVSAAVKVNDITKINPKEETFSLAFTLTMGWTDDRLRHDLMKDGELEQRLATRQEAWSAYWDPLLEIKNCVNPQLALGRLHKSVDWAEMGLVKCVMECNGEFSDVFPLQRFPYDRLLLRVNIVSKWGLEEMHFSHNTERPEVDEVSDRIVASEWKLIDAGASVHIPPVKNDTIFHELSVAVRVQRTPKFYLQNYIHPTGVLALTNAAAFSISPNVSGRLQYIVTHYLAIHALKLSANAHLPVKTYNTWADSYSTLCSLVPLATIAETFLMSLLSKAGLPVDKLDKVFLVVIYALWTAWQGKLRKCAAPLTWREVHTETPFGDSLGWSKAIRVEVPSARGSPGGVTKRLAELEGRYELLAEEQGNRPVYKKEDADISLRFANGEWQMVRDADGEECIFAKVHDWSFTPTNIPDQRSWDIKYTIPNMPSNAMRDHSINGVNIVAEE